MKRLFQSILCIFCSVALMSSVGFQVAYAQSSDIEVSEAEPDSIGVEKAPKNVQKLISENSKEDSKAVILQGESDFDITTKYSDGSCAANVYSVPVRYEDASGNKVLIDTSMKSLNLADSIKTGYDYKNAANDFTVLYSKHADEGIEMNSDFTMAVSAEESTKAQTGRIDSDENNDGRITYQNAFGEDSYLEYININTGVKENIILEKNLGKNTFSFVFDSDTHTPVLSEDKKSIIITENGDTQQAEYIIMPLYVYDNFKNQNSDGNTPSDDIPETEAPDGKAEATSEVCSEQAAVQNDKIAAASLSAEGAEYSAVDSNSKVKHFTDDCYYELSMSADGSYIITAVIPSEFLNNPNTVYPVTIDPSVTTTASTSTIDDTYVSQKYPTTNYGNYNYMCFGYNGGKMFGYVRFNTLPSSTTSSQIYSAKIKLTFRPGQTTSYQGMMYRVKASSWSETGITWNNQPYGYDCGATSDHHNCSYYLFDAVNLVKGWYNNYYSNYGVDFTYSNETYNDYNSVYSVEGSAANAPLLTIWYYTVVKTTYVNEGPSAANASFNRTLASEWALQYGSSHYNFYYDTPFYLSVFFDLYELKESKDDSASFVSECLHEGGMIYLGTPIIDIYDDTAWFYSDFGQSYRASRTWGKGEKFAKHWGHDINGNGGQRAYKTVIYDGAQMALYDWDFIYMSLWEGDVIQTVSSDGKYDTVIIHDATASTSNIWYDMAYARHSPDQTYMSVYQLLTSQIDDGSKIILHIIK